VIGVLLALMASAFFSGMESAFLNANRFRLELRQKQAIQIGRAHV
jgi:Mg2+/Co2+ transporter CorB